MASRAHLLAGLRTGGPRSSSPFEADGNDQNQMGQFSNNGSPPSTLSVGTLKANAAPFTPGSRNSPPASKEKGGVDGQAAALRMQQAIAIAASHRQPSPSEGQSDFAALYGASQGQPQQQQQQQQEMAMLIRQKQAQMLQNHLLAQQQQQQQQQQMDMYRLQAASQQQQHLQQVAAHQRLLLAQMQAEYSNQQQEQAYSAQDQRIAAQDSIQASLRQRQAEQMYAQLMEQQQMSQQHQGEDAHVQQQQLLQRLQFLQLQAAAASQMQTMQEQDDMSLMQSPSRRNGVSSRADSPNNAAKEQSRRDRQVSQTAADNATSWRSTSVSLSKAGRSASSRGATPSIVVDDSASEKSEEGGRSDNETTPETSEEDIGASSSSGASTVGKSSHRLGGLGAERRTPSTISTSLSPRPISLSQAPRSRAFTTEAKMTLPATNGSNGGATNGASRQPRGPPTEFHSINFISRLSARTRREAMSKLCASPRAASFSTNPRSAVLA